MKKSVLIMFLIIYMFSSLSILSDRELVKQCFIYLIGFFIIIFNKKINYNYSFISYIILNILLLYLLIFGDSINGSKCWINLLGISFQPSEFMKINLIVLLSLTVSKNNSYFLKSFIIFLIPSILTFLEPDTGNVVMYLVIYLSILFMRVKRINKKTLGVLSVCFITCLVVIFNYIDFSSYRFQRIYSLINNNSYQLNRSLINIGVSKFIGKTSGVYIPFYNTDFAFSYFISKNGLLIGIFLLVFINLFNFYLIKVSRLFVGYKKYMILSYVTLKVINENIHILMSIGLFPIMGIPLPFVSLGGSSLISNMIFLSIVGNMEALEA